MAKNVVCDIGRMTYSSNIQWLFVCLGLKKNIVCFRFPTDPIKTCATQIYFMDFPKKKKKKFFFFFFFFRKLISSGMSYRL